MKSIIALVDCNNFYVSCERVFNPALNDKPVVVLSNNDGIIISRSNEAKKLGIKMGDVYHKLKPFLKKNKVKVYSSNYTLYGDLSHRVMDVLSQYTPNIEIYSVDEAFLDLSKLQVKDIDQYIKEIRKTVMQWTGIPVSISLAPTKTLAKVAGKFAKKKRSGIFIINKDSNVDELLEKVPVSDVWGVGGQYTKLLNAHDISNALQLKNADDPWIKKKMTIVGLKMVHELRGEPRFGLEESPPSKKQIVKSCSFGKEIITKEDLQEAISQYTSVAVEKLRNQKSKASFVGVFIQTNSFKNLPQYANCAGLQLSEPSGFTPEFAQKTKKILDAIYKKGYSYKKAGVYLADIVSEDKLQYTLFKSNSEREKNKELMKVVDSLNRQWGDSTIKAASEGVKYQWKMKQAFKSKRFTTRWNELLVVK